MTNGPPPVRETTRTTRGKALGIAWHAHGSGATSRQGESRGRFRRQRPSRHRCGRKGHARCQAGPFDPQVGISDCFPTLKSLLQSALRASSAERSLDPPCIARTTVASLPVSAVAPVQLFRLLCVVCLRRQDSQRQLSRGFSSLAGAHRPGKVARDALAFETALAATGAGGGLEFNSLTRRRGGAGSTGENAR